MNTKGRPRGTTNGPKIVKGSRQCGLCKKDCVSRIEQEYLEPKTGLRRIALLCKPCIRTIFRGL